MKIKREWDDYSDGPITNDGFYPVLNIKTGIDDKIPVWEVKIHYHDDYIELDKSLTQNKTLDELMVFLEEQYPVDIGTIDIVIAEKKQAIDYLNDDIQDYVKEKQKTIEIRQKEINELVKLRKEFLK